MRHPVEKFFLQTFFLLKSNRFNVLASFKSVKPTVLPHLYDGSAIH